MFIRENRRAFQAERIVAVQRCCGKWGINVLRKQIRIKKYLYKKVSNI